MIFVWLLLYNEIDKTEYESPRRGYSLFALKKRY